MSIVIDTIDRSTLLVELRAYQAEHHWKKELDFETISAVLDVCINIVNRQKPVKKSVLSKAQNMALDFWRTHYEKEAVDAHKQERKYDAVNNHLLHGFYKGKADAYEDIAKVLSNLCTGYSGVGFDREVETHD